MLQYIIKLSISLSIVYLFYQLFLRRLTFYNCNRWYLLIYSMVCFVIPFINVFTIIVNQPSLRESAIINYIPAITQITQPADGKAVHINWMQVTIVVMITGMLLMVLRLVVQYYSLYRMRSKAILLYDDKVKLYHIDEPVIPFSFGRGIYVNQYQHSEQELKEIIHHEFIHVKQRHSLDIIWSELLCILNWYNPFAWLLRHDIRQNLEFIADQQVLQTGLDRKQYQYLLLKVIGVNSFSIANSFNFSSLKKRIAMMNKTKSARVHLIRFLFLLPLLVVVLLAFRNAKQMHQRAPVHEVVKDTLPKATKEMKAAWKEMRYFEITGYDSLNEYKAKVTLQLKNGETEKFDFAIPEEKLAFEKKYGVLPKMKTPPEPLFPSEPLRVIPEVPEVPEQPEAPEKPEARERPEITELREVPEAPEAPEAPKAPELTEVHAPVPPTISLQDCLNKKGYCITVVDNYSECVVIVKNKDNKIVTAVSLTDWNKDKQYESTYGEIPHRPIKILIKQKPVTVVNVKPETVVKVEPTMTLDVKSVTIIDAKPATVISIKAKHDPVKVINSRRINKAETKPFSAEKATPVASSIRITGRSNANGEVQVKGVSAVRVTSAVSAKSAVKVQVAAEPKATLKPVAEQPENKL